MGKYNVRKKVNKCLCSGELLIIVKKLERREEILNNNFHLLQSTQTLTHFPFHSDIKNIRYIPLLNKIKNCKRNQ